MTRNPWTPEHIALLRVLYPDHATTDIAARLGRAAASVYNKAHALGLRKSAAFLASDRSGRVQRGRQDPRMTAHQFKPGMTPWNKGTHYQAGGRSALTRFKPGRPPHEARNYKPIGTLRINKDGYLERKVSDDPRLAPVRRWVGVHRLVWEQAHGPIPPEHIVVFRPGMRTADLLHITADRLECISRAEHARRNHPMNKSPDLARLVQLKGCITRQVNRLTAQEQTS